MEEERDGKQTLIVSHSLFMSGGGLGEGLTGSYFSWANSKQEGAVQIQMTDMLLSLEPRW